MNLLKDLVKINFIVLVVKVQIIIKVTIFVVDLQITSLYYIFIFDNINFS